MRADGKNDNILCLGGSWQVYLSLQLGFTELLKEMSRITHQTSKIKVKRGLDNKIDLATPSAFSLPHISLCNSLLI
jgi:hypothetical protein